MAGRPENDLDPEEGPDQNPDPGRGHGHGRGRARAPGQRGTRARGPRGSQGRGRPGRGRNRGRRTKEVLPRTGGITTRTIATTRRRMEKAKEANQDEITGRT